LGQIAGVPDNHEAALKAKSAVETDSLIDGLADLLTIPRLTLSDYFLHVALQSLLVTMK